MSNALFTADQDTNPMTSTRNNQMTTSKSPQLVTVKRAAEMLGCSEANLYALLENGQIPYIPVGRRKGYRIDVADIQHFIEERKVRHQSQENTRQTYLLLKHLSQPMKDSKSG